MKKSWRSFVIASIAGLAAVLVSAAHHPVQAAQLVLFEGGWCPSCRYWNKTVAPGYMLSELGKKLPLRRFEVGTPRPTDLDKPFVRTIFGVPTFVVMDKGREIGRIEGFTSEKHFWKRLNAIMATQQASN